MVAGKQSDFKKTFIMTTSQINHPELLSALADGEAVFGAGDAGLEDAFQSSTLYSDWNNYQVIGHALRCGAAGEQLGADSAFLQRLNARLVSEKIILQGRAAASTEASALPPLPAANDAVFRWKLVAGFASLAAALVVGWSFVGLPSTPPGAQLAQNPAAEQVVVSSAQGPVVRDARLEELMAAHKQLGGSSLLAPSGFLRNAGFENTQSSRR